MKRLAIVGAGPAGLMAAIRAGERGLAPVVFERNSSPGKKLDITGGGHCNISNTLPIGEWPERFGKHGRFILPALTAWTQDDLADWFLGRGEPLTVVDGRFWYPESRSALRVRKLLTSAASDCGAEWRFNSRIEKIIRTGDRFSVDGEEFDQVILACGGKSYPTTGSTWDGCVMAESLGHTIVPPLPGLVGLHAENAMTDLSGLVFQDARVSVKLKGIGTVKGAGELLLTHKGVSGPAVLDLSAALADALARGKNGATIQLHVEWQAGREADYWRGRFDLWRRRMGGERVTSLLKDESFTTRFCQEICRRAGVPDDLTAANLTQAMTASLQKALSDYIFDITGTEPFTRAIITRGGVGIREIDPKTMESRKVKGLYFAGEMVDIDGPCGGFNLHWALASGRLAGKSAGIAMAGK